MINLKDKDKGIIVENLDNLRNEKILKIKRRGSIFYCNSTLRILTVKKIEFNNASKVVFAFFKLLDIMNCESYNYH